MEEWAEEVKKQNVNIQQVKNGVFLSDDNGVELDNRKLTPEEIYQYLTSVKEYQLREFCKAIDCGVYHYINSDRFTQEQKDEYKEKCQDCYANKLYQYLQDNRYKIVRE